MKVVAIIKVAILTLVVLAFMVLFLLFSWNHNLPDLPPSPTPINCLEGYREGMSPEEVAILTGIPLVVLDWLPDEVQNTPQIKPHGLEWIDSSNGVTCTIRITYPDIMIDVILLNGNSIFTTPELASCGRMQEMSTPMIHCSKDFVTITGHIGISMFTNYPLEIAQEIADGIRLVESEQ